MPIDRCTSDARDMIQVLPANPLLGYELGHAIHETLGIAWLSLDLDLPSLNKLQSDAASMCNCGGEASITMAARYLHSFKWTEPKVCEELSRC